MSAEQRDGVRDRSVWTKTTITIIPDGRYDGPVYAHNRRLLEARIVDSLGDPLHPKAAAVVEREWAKSRRTLAFVQAQCLHAGIELELALQRAMHEAFAADPSAVALLRELEWSDEADMGAAQVAPSCPCCGHEQSTGHDPTCRLASIIGNPSNAGVHAVSASLVKALAEIIYGLRDLGHDDRLSARMAEARAADAGDDKPTTTPGRSILERVAGGDIDGVIADARKYKVPPCPCGATRWSVPINGPARCDCGRVLVGDGNGYRWETGVVLAKETIGGPSEVGAVVLPGDAGTFVPAGGLMVVPDADGVCRPTSDVIRRDALDEGRDALNEAMTRLADRGREAMRKHAEAAGGMGAAGGST